MLKKISILIVAIIGLGVLAASISLLGAHQQIRRLVVEIPTIDDVKVLFPDENKKHYPNSINYLNTATQAGPFGTLGHVGVIISWSDGKQFLIDTGMNRAEAEKFGKPIELVGAEPTTTYGPIEEQMGEFIQDIAGIGFTHLHVDHTAGITDICEAQSRPATIFQTKQQAKIHNTFTKPGQSLINESNCTNSILAEGTIKAVNGFPGLYALPAGGHTPGSTIYFTVLEDKIWVFAGDITNAMIDIHNNKDKGWWYSYLLVPENVDLLLELRVWLKALDDETDIEVLVAHDIKAYEASELNKWAAPIDVKPINNNLIKAE